MRYKLIHKEKSKFAEYTGTHRNNEIEEYIVVGRREGYGFWAVF